MRATNRPGPPIDRPAETDGDTRRFGGRNQIRERRLNLFANAWAALGALNGQPSPLDDSCRFIADDDLQFRAADFDAEEVHQGSNTRTRYHRNAAFVITSVTVVVELAAAKNGRLAGTSSGCHETDRKSTRLNSSH